MNYCYHTRTPVERPRDTLVTLGYQCGQNEIQYSEKGKSGATTRYCTDTRIPVEPPKDAVVTLACQLPVEPARDMVVTQGTGVATKRYSYDTRVAVENQEVL